MGLVTELPEVSSEHHGDHTHRDVNGGWLRPAVFGAMDGLVSNFALIAGMDGGTSSGSQVIVLAGLAGLAAGAFSMAAGEYTSVASQRELARAEIEVERKEIARHPLDEEIELAETYRAKGLDPDLASKVAKQFHTDPDQALEEHVREELGIDPHDLPNPMLAAASSFICFAVGAFIPLAAVPARRGQRRTGPDPVADRALRLRRGRVAGDQPLLVVLRPPSADPRRPGRGAHLFRRDAGRASGIG